MITTTTLQRHFDAHRAAIDELVTLVHTQHATREREAGTAIDHRLVTTKIIGIVTLVLLGLVSVLVARSILQPVRYLHAAVADLAGGHGDLAKRLPAAGTDELSALCREFNRVLDRWHQIISTVSGAADAVADTARQLSESLSRLSTEARDQAGQAVQAAAAVEEMSATSAEMANQTEHVGATSESAAKASTEGHTVIATAMRGITGLGETVQAAASQIQSLGQRSDQIDEIVKVIRDIADQTNLLALNAAIEAARAGEQGRGFAVVADEVRKLAERTTKATNEIGETIRVIQSETRQAVAAMQNGAHSAAESMDMARQAGEHLGRIVRSAQEVSGLVHQIAAAVQEQSATSQQLASNVQSVAASSRRTEHDLDQTRVATEKLLQQANALQAVVGTFQL